MTSCALDAPLATLDLDAICAMKVSLVPLLAAMWKRLGKEIACVILVIAITMLMPMQSAIVIEPQESVWSAFITQRDSTASIVCLGTLGRLLCLVTILLVNHVIVTWKARKKGKSIIVAWVENAPVYHMLLGGDVTGVGKDTGTLKVVKVALLVVATGLGLLEKYAGGYQNLTDWCILYNYYGLTFFVL
jgi:hypothetical protein